MTYDSIGKDENMTYESIGKDENMTYESIANRTHNPQLHTRPAT